MGDDYPEPTAEELAEMEAAFDEVYDESVYDQGDDYEWYEPDDWDPYIDGYFEIENDRNPDYY